MRKCGFPDGFMRVIQTLYDRLAAQIKINRYFWFSEELHRDAQFPLLALFIEPLGQLIRLSKALRLQGSNRKRNYSLMMFCFIWKKSRKKTFTGLMTLLADLWNDQTLSSTHQKHKLWLQTLLPQSLNLQWEALKYLAISLTKHLSKWS